MATIKATPNPVVFPGFETVIPIKMSTTITWNSFPQLGQVYLVRGGQTTRIDDGGNPQFGGFSDRPAQPIEVKDSQLGETFDVRLTKPNDPNTLLSQTPLSLIKVTTEKEVGFPQALLDGRLIPKVQGIYRLTVDPGVNTVTIAFRTRLPTTPFVAVHYEDTGEIAGLFMKPDVRTKHKVVFDPLMPRGEHFDLKTLQNTRYTYRIVASKTPNVWGTDPTNAIETGTFHTGSQTATFFFDKIHVRTDGDPSLKGAGEFTFRFDAGDVVTKEGLGNIGSWGEGDINAGDDVDVNQVVTIPIAPRLVGVSVSGNEHDYLFPGISAVGRGPRPPLFRSPGEPHQ